MFLSLLIIEILLIKDVLAVILKLLKFKRQKMIKK